MKNKKILQFVVCILAGIAAWFIPLNFLGISAGFEGIHYFVGLLVFFSLLGIFKFIPALLAVLISALIIRSFFNW